MIIQIGNGNNMLIGKKTIGTVAHMFGWPAVPEPFHKAWGDIIQYNYEYLLKPTERIQYIRPTVSYHSFARDSLIDAMMGEWILMLDTDVVPEPDVVSLMLSKMNYYNIDVLVGIYPWKGEIHAPVVYGWDEKTKNRFIIGDWDKRIDVQPCDGAGAGCLMLRRSVVEKVKKESKTSLFAIKEPFSEDNSFFIRCREVGIPVYFTPHVRLQHLIYKGLTVEDDFPKYQRITKHINKVKAMA